MRIYNKSINVYDAMEERFDFIFNNFKRIYVSFSGGKDSGVMLNLILDYIKKNKIDRKIGVMILDNEANYEYSLEFMHDILESNREYLDIYWCCLPITLPCTISSYAVEWQCWNTQEEHLWVRPMPPKDYVVSMKNNPLDYFRENMNYDEFWDKFGDWYSQGERTACLIGIRTVESLNRFRAIMNLQKETLDGRMWTKKIQIMFIIVIQYMIGRQKISGLLMQSLNGNIINSMTYFIRPEYLFIKCVLHLHL